MSEPPRGIFLDVSPSSALGCERVIGELHQHPSEAKTMRVRRAIAGTSVIVCFMVLAAIGQQGHSPHQDDPETQLENCQTAMQVIVKQYNNARYAVQRARNSGDTGHILSAVNDAQLALDTMEQPLKICNEVVQNMKNGHPRDSKN
jgi:hypothetical protein